jgi:hypothetical protein
MAACWLSSFSLRGGLQVGGLFPRICILSPRSGDHNLPASWEDSAYRLNGFEAGHKRQSHKRELYST